MYQEYINKINLGDCKEYMKEMPDKCIDLAIIDPPYGIEQYKNKQPSRINKYENASVANNEMIDSVYIQELFRISINQILFGFNHYCNLLPPTKEFIFWYKHQPVDTYSDGELAWTSFNKTAKCFDYPYCGSINSEGKRIHPYQKPVILYRWVLQNYAKQGDLILDTHSGSGSLPCACYHEGIDFIAIEKYENHWKASTERLEELRAQGRMFV